MALTAVSTVAWPLIRITGTFGHALLQPRQELEAVHAGHHDVREDRVHGLVAEPLQGARAGRGGEGL